MCLIDKNAVWWIVVLMALLLSQVGAANAKEVICTLDGREITSKQLMGVSRAEFVQQISGLFSWEDTGRLKTELSGFSLDPKKGKKELLKDIGGWYDNALRDRLLEVLAAAYVEQLGIKKFHYDRESVDKVLKEQERYDTEYDTFLKQVARTTDDEKIEQLADAFISKWLKGVIADKAVAKGYVQTFVRRAKEHAGTNLPLIVLYRRHYGDHGKWVPASTWTRRVRTGNAAYHIRNYIFPAVAKDYLEAFVKHYIKYNIFIVRLTKRDNVPVFSRLLRKIVTPEGLVVSNAINRVNMLASSLDTRTHIIHQQWNLLFIQNHLGYGKSLENPVDFRVPARLVPQFEKAAGGKHTSTKKVTTANSDRTPTTQATQPNGDSSYFWWCWITSPVAGSSDYLRTPAESNPRAGLFHEYLSQYYLQPQIAFFLDKKYRPSKSAPEITSEELRRFIQASNVQQLLFGWRMAALKPID